MAGGVALAQPGNRAAGAEANNDGNVTRAEAQAAATARFVRMDANNDGRLTPEDRSAQALDWFGHSRELLISSERRRWPMPPVPPCAATQRSHH